MESIPLVTWQLYHGILFLTITALFLILLLFGDCYLLGKIIYLKGQEPQTFLHQDDLLVSYPICYRINIFVIIIY